MWLNLRVEVAMEFQAAQAVVEYEHDVALLVWRTRRVAAQTAASAAYRNRLKTQEPERWAEYKAKWNATRNEKRRLARAARTR